MKYNGCNICMANGYPAIYVNGTVMRIHVLEMEKHLGRKLKPEECVHHQDEDKTNYHIENLLCFRSNADHTAFHKGRPVALDEEGIAYCPTKAIRKNQTLYRPCPRCGKLMSTHAEMCIKCYRLHIAKTSKKPDKQDLEQLLKIHNLTQIGKLFGVSANAVKKWLKYYDINCSYRIDIPDKSALILELQNGSMTNVAKNRNVSVDTVRLWMKKYNITYIPARVQCVETKEVFTSMLKAADKMYPKMSRKSVGNFIGKVINTDEDYHGYHWIYTDKIVC